MDKPEVEADIKAKLIEIADKIGSDARSVENDEIIPATGLLDSAGIFELIAWYEIRYEMTLAQEEITIHNLGSISRMADYVIERKKRD